MRKIVLLATILVIPYLFSRAGAPVNKADVIIYGGTSAAIVAAVQAHKMGKTVIVVSPDKHVGGLSSGGLGFTDTGNKSVIGGLARDFYHRIWLHYQQPVAWKWQQQAEYGNKGQGTPAMDGAERTMWIFEPHVAEQVFEDYIRENNLKIYRNEWLDRKQGVKKEGGKIVAITTLSGQTYSGKVFIDATYEGDLMAAAGVSYTVGREAVATYGESWNGVQTGVLHHGHYFKQNISPYRIAGDATSGLLPRVSGEDPGEKGAADKKIQAYCFRMCLTDKPANRIPFPKPEGYDPTQYELLTRVLDSGWNEVFSKFDPIPNHKTDVNNHGPFSFDNIGMNYDYPEATYERRKEIIHEHEVYQQGLLYFLANDARVPAAIQRRMQTWGLSADEFRDNHNWPHQLYVREARRMKGVHVMTQQSVLGESAVPQSIGMGSYTLDAHNAQRYVKKDGYVQNEGDIGVDIKEPYQVSYGSILPQRAECSNLLVPVCMSASHIAYGSIRMEPVFMILGQSAATAAALAIDGNKAVQEVDYGQLKAQLEKDHQRLSAR
ncbi:FAD dependent oxidoreductase [Chitinophaga ginsengisegetis]|uniref:FAD dependent oxidoreductase n=1 Tax=Chitinophaga ginsengisegetis TaxID=393003 RepID=A0A1T5P0H8_9BACT|nr:FAD-dependent oxidoreductase [Chitinophaga ginsengisegetis]SKD06192.1 FAD dependent oxidoreductase [Chitinophaga ginsengisegetis]